ncbi:YhgE/Pip domain-containing protein [Bacillus sp. V5-8f]|uniref:YhgE/Pip domain-containing protein n=1 Tax=Bacillus sp. V5-8f TaxID=2053044 RepID=UPI0015E0EAA1|nr:YhgE/Pip domain-containing protein [Bacillus sp. V5-8f]
MKGLGLQPGGLGDRKGFLIAIIAVLLVPLMYAGIILTANWGPYDNLKSLPVAVLNKDTGAMSGDKVINVGEDLVADLKKSNTLGWEFVDSKQAERGLKDLDYYMVIEIPEDFSKKVTTVLDENPQKPQLKFIQNEGLHFMAAQVTNNATERIKNQLADKITETYTKTLFDSMGEISTGFKEGADGATQINEGSAKLHDGTGKIVSSLNEKAPDINRLADGAKELKAGTNTMHTSLASKQGDIAKLADGASQVHSGTNTLLQNLQQKQGDITKLANGTGLLLKSLQGSSGNISKLADGAKQIDDGANQLAVGSASLEAGAAKILAGLKTAEAGSNQLDGGMAKLEPGTKAVADGTSAVDAGSQRLAVGTQQVADGIEQLSKHPVLGPILMADPNFQKLREGSKAVAAGAGDMAQKTPALSAGAKSVADGISGQVAPGVKALAGGLDQLVAGQTELTAGAQKLNAGAQQLASGTGALAAGNATVNSSWGTLTNSVAQISSGNQAVDAGWKTMTAGVSKLEDGAGQVAAGNQTVKTGWGELTTGAGKINNGMTQVSDGTQSVKTGWGTLTNGVTQVDNGIAKVEDGSKELATGLAGGAEKTGAIKTGDNNISQFAAPVELAGETINKFPKYRYANAPYILSLALFVGVLLMSLLFDLKKPAITAVSPFRWYLGKFGNMAGLAVAQALIVSVFASFFLKSNAANGFSLIWFSVLVSLTFLTIVFFLVLLAGNIGRFIAFTFLVLQLSTTGSALPIHMLPDNLQALSKILPMTYSIGGYKSIITLNHYGAFWANISALFVFLAVFAVLSLVIIFFRSNKRIEQNEAVA